jgi:hypothetical protein
MPVALRNRLTNPVMVQPQTKDTRPLIWRPAGDQGGEDVLMIPDELAQDTAIIKAIKLGRISVINDEAEIDRIYDQQAQASLGMSEQQAQATASHIDTQSVEGVMIGLPCIAAGNRPNQSCPNQAVIPLTEKTTTPPLCTEHHHLAPQFAYVAGTDGQPDRWVRIAPQKQ